MHTYPCQPIPTLWSSRGACKCDIESVHFTARSLGSVKQCPTMQIRQDCRSNGTPEPHASVIELSTWYAPFMFEFILSNTYHGRRRPYRVLPHHRHSSYARPHPMRALWQAGATALGGHQVEKVHGMLGGQVLQQRVPEGCVARTQASPPLPCFCPSTFMLLYMIAGAPAAPQGTFKL